MTHVTCQLTAKNRDQLRNPTLGNRVWVSFTTLVIIILFSANPCHRRLPPSSSFSLGLTPAIACIRVLHMIKPIAIEIRADTIVTVKVTKFIYSASIRFKDRSLRRASGWLVQYIIELDIFFGWL